MHCIKTHVYIKWNHFLRILKKYSILVHYCYKLHAYMYNGLIMIIEFIYKN
jgi:hypothetical protein